MNDFNLTDFEDKMVGFGSVMFMVYVCITAVLIVNLLIAVLANSYEKISTAVDASNRAVLIQFYKQYKWDEKYGFLIFLASPFSVINFAVLPIFFLHRGDMVKFNLFVTRIYYILFYFPFFVLPFMIYTVVLIPLSYIKGMVIMIKYQSKLKVRAYTKILYILKWIFFGLFFLLFVSFIFSFFTKKLHVEELNSIFTVIGLVFSTILYKQIIMWLFPLVALQMSFVFYLPAVSSYVIGIIYNNINSKTFNH